ncbi:uncharacterized protein LOC6560990 [Drosophila grimshawi]|uniref:uncharacterized protein LOC6560990 n=1 Tax=Drosophila grimshawi TaxID=7222 RepID=UPI000C870232|nr:uncharacterized protein LOC6560990 [Drosophila grimshawi]
MDMDIKVPKRSEIEQFLLDVRAHFRESLTTSEYENTSNLFHVTAAEQTQALLERCDLLLAAAAATTDSVGQVAVIKLNGCIKSNNSSSSSDCFDSKVGAETGCYLEMLSSSAATSSSSRNSLSASREYIDLSSNPALNVDKAPQQPEPVELPESEQQLYDICQHQAEDETQQVFAHELFINCPYADLPAGHLALQRSTKYGQLQRIEKRLFFDQSKKCYCGILNDWMLCYADGPTSCRPSSSLYLKSSAIEIEHFGEGKRREICFQITTADPGKKFVYQANNEVDAKEWIHAIEAAIRGDAIAQATLKTLRKLPTPPTVRKCSYLPTPTNCDSIYEEPSPIYNFGEAVTPPRLPDKANSPSALARRFEYDIPKCPPQPLSAEDEPSPGDVETAELLNGVGSSGGGAAAATIVELKPQPQASSLHGHLTLDFQAKVKTVHSELSSQLTSPERLKKAVKKSYSCGNSEPEMLSLTNSPPAPATLKEQKKQRKSQTPQTSPQKTPSKDCDKLARNWFLSRLNKSSTGQSTRSTGSGSGSGTSSSISGNSSIISSGNATGTPTNAKCKQSEKENLLNGLDLCDGNYDPTLNEQQPSSNPTSPCLKGGDSNKSKVNMIINQFESSGHLSTMFSVEALAANALASLTSFCESDNCNNYEPIMPLATPPTSFLKKV